MREVFTSYFEVLKETLIKHDLMDKPFQIYNCNESGMPLEHKMPKPLFKRVQRKFASDCLGIKPKYLF